MSTDPISSAAVSPLFLADRLLSLAQQADQAGLTRAATDLLALVDTVLTEPPDQRLAATGTLSPAR